MGLNEMNVSINPQKIHYAEATFKRLVIREVYDGEDPNGEYHIKPISKVNLQFLSSFLKKWIPSVEIGIADPDGVLGIEYPIYLKSGVSRNDIIQLLENADIKLDELIKNRGK